LSPTAVPSFKVLGLLCGSQRPESLPEARGGDAGEGEKDAQGDAEAPDGLDLVTRSLVGVDPLEGVVARVVDVVEERVDKGGSVAPVVGEILAVEVADGPANDAGNDDDGDEDCGIRASRDEERQHLVPVKNVSDGNVNDCHACL
jgi:hypothetical protein